MIRTCGVLASAVVAIGCGPSNAPPDGPSAAPVRRVALDDSAAGLSWPTSLATDRDGGFYVAEIRTGIVHRFAADGRFVQHYGRPGDGPGELRAPAAIAVVADTLVAVADFAHQSVELFNRATGSFVTRIALPVRAELLKGDADGLWIAAPDPLQATGLLRAGPPNWELTTDGRLPIVYRADGPVVASYRRVLPSRSSDGTLFVGFEVVDSIDRRPPGGEWARFALPRRVRRGLLADPNTSLGGLRFDEIMVAQSSLVALGAREDGRLVAIHADQRLTSPPPIRPGPNGRLPVTADLYASVLDPPAGKACVDAHLPSAGELIPQVAIKADTVFVLDQMTVEGRAATVITGYVLDATACRWL